MLQGPYARISPLERDNVANVTPHAEFVGSGLYEFLPALSRGTGQPDDLIAKATIEILNLRPTMCFGVVTS